jgi:hypothetical protein
MSHIQDARCKMRSKSKSKGERGANGLCQAASGYHEKFAQQRITVAAAAHDACLGKTAAQGPQDLKISLCRDVIRWPLKILGKVR